MQSKHAVRYQTQSNNNSEEKSSVIKYIRLKYDVIYESLIMAKFK